MCDLLQPQELQHTRLPCPSLSSRVCSNSCPVSQQVYESEKFILFLEHLFLIFQNIINIIGTVQYFSRGLSLSGLRDSVQITCLACLSNEGLIQHAGKTMEQRMTRVKHSRTSLSLLTTMYMWILCKSVYIYRYRYDKWWDNESQFSHVGLGSDKQKENARITTQ